jgi:glyoxylase-like metal-dependent hydrolase (beta-lactamase superfamily II)
MKIGGYELFPIETGTFALDGGAMFGVVPRPLWEKTNPPDALNRITLAARPLLLVGHGKKILVDTGNGTKFKQKHLDIYRLDTSRHSLENSLRKCGIAMGEITDVILTHLHFDHAGGSTYRDGGELKPAFPRATYHVQKAHWEQAINPTEKDRASFMPEDYLPLKDRGMLQFVEGEYELFPHISLVVTNGHTASQQLPKISDGTTTLLYTCDLFPTVAHLHLPYIMAYDLRPLVTLEEKRKTLEAAVEEGWILFFEHDPDTVAGRVSRNEKGYIFGGPVDLSRR